MGSNSTVQDTTEFKELVVSRQYGENLPTGQEQKILQGTLNSNFKTGASASAVYGKLDYKDTGSAHGMAQAITAETILPNSSLQRGQINAIDLELGGGASTSWASAGPVTFMRMGAWGAGLVAGMNLTNAYIMDIQGLTSTSGGSFDATQAPAAANASLKIRVGGTDYFIMLSTTAN